MLEREGIFLLNPVSALLFRDEKYLRLNIDTISVTYKTYRNTYKGSPVQHNEHPIQDAIDQKLNLGFLKLVIRS